MKKRTYIFIFSVVVAFLICLGFYIYKWEYRRPIFEVNFFSLNRGRAVFIRSPLNKTIVVGGGQNSGTIRELTKVMPFYSRKIDYVFIPGATPAQVGGLIEIFDRYDVGEIIMSKIMATSTVLDQVMKSVSLKKIHVREVERGDMIEIGGLKVQVLFPDKDFKFNKTSLPDLGLEISYKGTVLFLLGNLSKTIQKNISNYLKVNFHESIVEIYNSGIEAKVSGVLFEKINPKYIFTTKEKSTSWVSDGEVWNMKN